MFLVKVKDENANAHLSRKTLGLYVKTAWNYPNRLILSFVSSSVFTLTQDIALPFLFAQLIDILANQTVDYSKAYDTFWMIVGVLVVNFLVARLSFVFRNPVMSDTLKDLSLLIFKKYEEQEYRFYTDNFAGSLVARANRFMATFKDLYDATLFQITPLILQFSIPVIILGRRSLLLGALFFFAATILIIITLTLGRIKTPHLRRAAAADSRVTAAIADALTNHLAIKVFARDKYELDRFDRVAEDRRELFNVQMTISEKIRAVRSAGIIIFQIAVAFVLVRLTESHHISVGTILLAQLYLVNLTQSLWVFNRVAERLEESVADAAEMTQVILREPEVKDVPRAKKLKIKAGDLDFAGVSFAYEKQSSEQEFFQNLSLHIPAGQKVGLVGPSGGGKTTFTKLLLRFMDVDSGQILLDGQDISLAAQDDLRRHITYVPQEPLLFHRSIKENISYGNPEASDEEIVKAAKLAHADEFISRLPQGYETLVGERGVKLSGGEKQRIAIARAMLKKSPILVLDEATSALDSKSEKAIVAGLDALMQNRTTVVIAHRLSTIRKLDRIVVLKDGQVVEDGSHQALLRRKNGAYAELWHHQSGEFLEA